MAFVPSGEQYQLTWEDQRAVVVEVGGGVRSYHAGGRPVLDPYRPEEMCDGAHGTPLIPWPNRLEDGSYVFDGDQHQVALTEPARHNAIHGFLRWRSWQAAERTADSVVMRHLLMPLAGWPFALALSIRYALGPEGLEVTTGAENIGDRACPFGAGQHPYLSPGSGLVDDCVLEFRAAERIVTDPDRQLPVGREPVAGSRYDFSEPKTLGPLQLDDCFTGLGREPDGTARVALAGPDGRVAELWMDATYPYLELYTGDSLGPARRRRGLGVEPMTCPPNAYRSGESLVRLEPGQSHTARWGVRLR